MKQELIDFVKYAHQGQVRKYSGEPYFNHLERVAEMARQMLPSKRFAEEVAYCHDLFEDTDIDEGELVSFLCFKCNYQMGSAVLIATTVRELSDYYTKENYPRLNRSSRKAAERLRMESISELAQNIKCLDIVDNSRNIKELDPEFAKVYLIEKVGALNAMDKAYENIKEGALLSVCQNITAP